MKKMNFVELFTLTLLLTFLYFIIPVFAEDIVLTGRQKEKSRVIDLNKQNIKISSAYIVPKNYSLTIHGSGNIRSDSTKVASLVIEGTLRFGPKKIKKEKGKPLATPLINFEDEKTTIYINKDYSRAYSQNTRLHNSRWKFNEGQAMFASSNFTGEETRLTALTGYTGKLSFKKCIFVEGRYDIRPYPENIIKHVLIDSCVFQAACDSNLAMLWAMKRCDLYEEPFKLKLGAWKKLPKTKPSIHCNNSEFMKLMHITLKNKFKDFKLTFSKKPFNKKLVFLAGK